MAMSSFMRGVCMTGSTRFRTIFSMMSGTAMMSLGFTSVKALAIRVGDGRRLRKNKWLPLQNPKRNSMLRPYMWAMGRMSSMGEPDLTTLPNRRRQKSMLPQMAL